MFKINSGNTRKRCEICSEFKEYTTIAPQDEDFCTNSNRLTAVTQLTFTCLKSTIEKLEKEEKYVQS